MSYMTESLTGEYQTQESLWSFLKEVLNTSADEVILELKFGNANMAVRFRIIDNAIVWSIDGKVWSPYTYLYSELSLPKDILLFRRLIQQRTDKEANNVTDKQHPVTITESGIASENKEFLILKKLAQRMLNSLASCEDENLKNLAPFLAKKTLKTRNGRLRSDGLREERVLPALLVLLYASESQVGHEKLSQLLNRVLNRFYTDSLDKAREISAFFYNKGFTHKDVFYLLSVADLNFVKAKIIDRWDDLLKLFKDKKYIAKVASYSRAKDKFDFFANMQASELDELSKIFNGYHLSQIVRGSDWEKKLAIFAGHKVTIGDITIGGEEDLKKWKSLFNGFHLSQIVVGAGWEKKLAVFAGHKVTIGDITIDGEEDLKKWKSLFNGYHLSQIVYGANWEKKLARALDRIPTIINKINEFVVKNSIHEDSISVIELKLGLLLALSLRKSKGKWRKAFLDCLGDISQVLSVDLNQFEIDLLTRTQNAKNRRAVLRIYKDMENDYGISSKGVSILLSAIYGGVLGKILGLKNTISSSSGTYSFDAERSASDERTMHTLVGEYDEAFDIVDTKCSLRSCLPDDWNLSDEYLEELANLCDKLGLSDYERIADVSKIIHEYFLSVCNGDTTKAQERAKETLLDLLNLDFSKVPPELLTKLKSKF